MAILHLYLFGTPRLELDGHTVKIERRKSLALAAYLALAELKQSRDVIASLLWPELDDDRARSSLRSALHTLTTPFTFEWIEADRMTLSLKQDHIWVDVLAFTTAVDQMNEHAHDPDILCDVCVELHQQAVELYQEDFLSGFYLQNNSEYDDWQFLQSQWLRREFMGVLRRLAQHEARAKRLNQAINYARRWLALDELHEPAHRLLIQLLAANNQRSEALRQYQRCVHLLDVELATVPEEETVQLYRAIQDNQFSTDQISSLKTSSFVSILPPSPSLVIGRESALQEVKQALRLNQPEAIHTLVIQGWPGVGKSTLMALIAHEAEIAQRYPDGTLWVSLGENPDLYSEISVWADALGLNKMGQPRKVEEISAQITAALRDKRVLLLVDDVWQPEHAAPLRVGGQGCTLILTSRLNDVATAMAPTVNDIYRLPVLTEDAGLQLLNKLSPETVAQHPVETRELVCNLEGLPLAIHIAGRLLHAEARLGWGVGELLIELREGARLLQADVPNDMNGFRPVRDASPTVSALLKRSTDLLNVETRRAFALLGLFVPKPATFDLAALAAVWDVDDPRPIARTLVNRGLLDPISGGRFQMHALLVLHARSLLSSESESPL